MTRRVAHIVQKMAPGGLEVLALELARQLPGDNFILTLQGEPSDLMARWPRLAPLGDRLIGLHKRDGLDATLPARLRHLFCRLGVDSIVTHHAGPLIYGATAARSANVRRILHVEHDVWHYRSARRRALARTAAMIARPVVVGVTERMMTTLARIFPGDRPHIIRNGVELDVDQSAGDALRRAIGADGTAKIIGSVGRLESVKGHDLLIAATAQLPDNIHVVLIGDGSRRESLQQMARELGISARLHFLGHRDDVRGLYGAFDVCCQPSRDEGLPFAVLEAQAAGVPVVATNVGDLAAAVCPRSGRIVRPEDPIALAAALRGALGASTALSPRAFISERFAWRDTLAGYARLLEL